MTIELLANAKINLTLDCVGKRYDGYHLLKTVMQSISLSDKITLCTNNSATIKITSQSEDIPCNEKNSCYKACVKFFEFLKSHSIPFDENIGITINIEKHIPTQAGMGGGSADAGSVIIGLNKIFNTNLSNESLVKIGEKVGADVPFCICGGTALCEGIGEIITPLNAIPHCYIVVVKPNIGVSTPLAFKMVDSMPTSTGEKTDILLQAISNNNIYDIAKATDNDFERAYSFSNNDIIDFSIIQTIKDNLIFKGALNCAMTGSGSTVFAIFDNKEKAQLCVDSWQGDEFIELCEPINNL